MRLLDTVQIAEVTSDGYGDKNVTSLTNVKSLFLQSTSRAHYTNVDIKNADAHVYLDITNPIVKSNGYKLEGMYLKANMFGSPDSSNWYRISKVIVGQRKLLNNKVDNVHAFLQRVADPDLD